MNAENAKGPATWIVAKLSDSGTPVPAYNPVQHPEFSLAVTEANRLATKHQGQAFAVIPWVNANYTVMSEPAHIPTSSLSKAEAYTGWYKFDHYGDESTRGVAVPAFACVGPDVAFCKNGSTHEQYTTRSVMFFSERGQPMARPQTRNLRWSRVNVPIWSVK